MVMTFKFCNELEILLPNTTLKSLAFSSHLQFCSQKLHTEI